MPDVMNSLGNISTSYSVFEKNQVLTPDQLNSISDYFDDQTRLTRIKLLGVGIVCGLRVSMQDMLIKVTEGVGLTTDGDLLCFNTDTVFDRFKLYNASHPGYYSPFYVGDNIIPLYELVGRGVQDTLAVSLDQFNTTEKTLNNMVAVLFMESYVNDPDICSGTDCDNLGKKYISTIKLLLVDRASVGFLQAAVITPTPNEAFSRLNEIIADRPIIPLSTNALNDLVKIYGEACNKIHGKLIAALPKLYSEWAIFLPDIFPSDPTLQWDARLDELNRKFVSDRLDVQYYYDFLKDIVETHNDFRNLLFGDTTWCSPDADQFPKHLLLGNLFPGINLDENRTGLYPSPLVSKTAEQLGHAKFLFQKLDTLIQMFEGFDATSAVIRVTPSLFEDQPLEERAIPCYYRVDEISPIHKNWNYRLHQRGMDAYNYSYNAGLYGAQGGAANPLTSQIGRFSFFRIEGHLGQPVSTVRTTIEGEINNKNLPFTVQSILLGTDKDHAHLVKPSGPRYSDLHRLHYLLRQDLTTQLGEVAQFSRKFKEKVDIAVGDKTVIDSHVGSDALRLTETVNDRNSTIMSRAASASAKLNRRYSAYIQDRSWVGDIAATISNAGSFKSSLVEVVKTGFTTPFDALIGDSKIAWLGWLDEIIKNKENGEDSKLLFSNFIALHPGIEHFSGVVRGGTFVLVYNTKGVVVADFMLPYYCCEVSEVEPVEVPFPRPAFKSDSIIEDGVKLVQSRNTFINAQLRPINDNLDLRVNRRLDTVMDTIRDMNLIRVSPRTITPAGGTIPNDQSLSASSGVSVQNLGSPNTNTVQDSPPAVSQQEVIFTEFSPEPPIGFVIDLGQSHGRGTVEGH